MAKYILTINAGSSSIKFALYSGEDLSSCSFSGMIERIGFPDARVEFIDQEGKKEERPITARSKDEAIIALDIFLHEHIDFAEVAAVGHRIVHGMERKEHMLVTPALVAALKNMSAIDPEHLPFEIGLLEKFTALYPHLPQVACFDTVFHSTMPRVAEILPLPRRFDREGVRRYGFHGLSCAYLVEELGRSDPATLSGRTIILHLGSGASVTAVREGKSIDTSMGFTPSGGIPMSSRTGDLDPGALLHIMKSAGLTVDDARHMINHGSGLLGVSETSADMRDLLAVMDTDVRAEEAVAFFCAEVKKKIGAYAAVLGGVDTLIFSGGMGAHAPHIRERILAGLEFLGVTLDSDRNKQNNAIISSSSSSVCVRVIETNEEMMIARYTRKFITI